MCGLIAVACSAKAPSVAEVPVPASVSAPAPAGREVNTHAAQPLEGGVTLREVALESAGTRTTLWIYEPPAQLAGPRPVILIGAAGTPLIWGMDLGIGDRPEHLPWAQHGYLVVAYSLDGHVAERDEPSIVAGVRSFVRANAGLENTRAALEHVRTSEARADRDRIYAVGHSSAATLALRVGAELPQIKAIVAFNAITDVERDIAELLPTLRAIDPGAPACVRASSPISHVAALRTKPLLLFHSRQDDVVAAAETEHLASALAPMHERSKVLIVPMGDHHASMIEQGIPAAIAWLDAVSSLTAR